MIKDKRLRRNIDKLATLSINEKGLDAKMVTKSLSLLKTLPRPRAIQALSVYSKRLRAEVSARTLSIESSIDLPEAQVDEIRQVISKIHHVTQVQRTTNSSLLGGLRVKIGDLVFDDSVSRKIEQVKGAISKGS